MIPRQIRKTFFTWVTFLTFVTLAAYLSTTSIKHMVGNVQNTRHPTPVRAHSRFGKDIVGRTKEAKWGKIFISPPKKKPSRKTEKPFEDTDKPGSESDDSPEIVSIPKETRTQEIKTDEAVFAKRRHRMVNVCRSDPEAAKGDINGIFTHNGSGVIWGFAPKAGCTFWKRVFNAVNKEDSPENEDVFGTTRVKIHQIAPRGVPFNRADHSFKRFPTRFVVARDPFSRLLSTWLDKFYLPDFWPLGHKMVRKRIGDGGKIQNDFIRKHYDQLAAKYEEKYNTKMSTGLEQTCGKYMTFSEFIAAIVQADAKIQNTHWLPLARVTNPCRFNATHVMHMDTFTEDARFILDKLGMPHLLDDFGPDEQVQEELKTIVNFNFWKINKKEVWQGCTSAREIAYRLWYNFRWRGYLHPDVDYVPTSATETAEVQKDLESQLKVARERAINDRAKPKAAKKDFFRKAYLTLSPELLEMLLKRYNDDFKLYGFEKARTDMKKLFAEST